MKKLRVILLILLVICLPIIPVQAQDNYVYDTGNYFSSTIEEILENLVDNFHERYNLNISIISVCESKLNGEFDLAEYSNQYYQAHYDNNDYGISENKDGLLLVLDMSSREWYISTCGKVINIFTDQNIEYLGKVVLSDLKDDNYFNAFIDHVNEFAENYKPLETSHGSNNEDVSVTKEIKDSKNDKENQDADKKSSTGGDLLVSLFLGFLIAYGIGKFKLRKLKTKRKVYDTNNYIKEDSFVLTKSNDLFLFSNVKKRCRSKSRSESNHHHHHKSKPKPSKKSSGYTTHYSSSNRRHDDGGGKF